MATNTDVSNLTNLTSPRSSLGFGTIMGLVPLLAPPLAPPPLQYPLLPLDVVMRRGKVLTWPSIVIHSHSSCHGHHFRVGAQSSAELPVHVEQLSTLRPTCPYRSTIIFKRIVLRVLKENVWSYNFRVSEPRILCVPDPQEKTTSMVFVQS
jgi:hypothetical protein